MIRRLAILTSITLTVWFTLWLAAHLPHWVAEAQTARHEPPVRPPTLQLPIPPAVSEPATELRGVWIHIYRPQDWDAICRELRAAGFNAIFLRVARGGEALYPSQLLPQEPWARQAGTDELAKAIDAAHRHGLQLHAWKVCYHLGSLRRHAREDPPAKAFWDQLNQEGRLVQDSNGRTAHWLNPADPRNLQLEVAVAKEVVEKYPVDGYHLDYIRYPDDPSFDFDYGPVSATRFSQYLRRPVRPWPDAVRWGSLQTHYLLWQQDQVTDTVAAIRAAVKAVRSDVLLSAAVWRNISVHCATVKQRWPLWAHQGLLDFTVLMNYEKDLEGFREELEDALIWNDGARPLVAGIGSWRLPPEAVLQQVQAARQLGADGFVLFSYNAEAIHEQLRLLQQQACRQPADPGLEGPAIEWLVQSPSFKNRYTHRLVPSDQATDLTVRTVGDTEATVVGTLIARTPDGRVLLRATVRLDQATEARVRLPHPLNDPVQLVLRGVSRMGTRSVPFARRSGWIVPVSPAEFYRWQRTLSPPERAPSGKTIGYYAYGRGAGTLASLLESTARGRVVAFYQLRNEHLRPLDVAFILPYLDMRDVTPEAIRQLRRWVANGGTLVLLGRAVGRHWVPGPFPELARGDQVAKSSELRIAGRPFRHPCEGHIVLRAAGTGLDVWARDAAGRAVVARGSHGRGAVWFVGLGPEELEADPTTAHRMIEAVLASVGQR